jgi:hypothetical protein
VSPGVRSNRARLPSCANFATLGKHFSRNPFGHEMCYRRVVPHSEGAARPLGDVAFAD